MKVKVAQLCSTLCDPMDCRQPGSSCLWEFSGQEYWSGLPCPPPGHLLNLGIQPRSPTLQADYLPAEPQGKPKNTGVGSLSLLQWIFPPQEFNQGLLHCRLILYQLNSQGSRHWLICSCKYSFRVKLYINLAWSWAVHHVCCNYRF